MRKFKTALLSVLAFVLGLFCLASCGEKENSGEVNYAGTYKFESMVVTSEGATVTLKVGETYMGMISLSADFMVVELKADGTPLFLLAGHGQRTDIEQLSDKIQRHLLGFPVHIAYRAEHDDNVPDRACVQFGERACAGGFQNAEEQLGEFLRSSMVMESMRARITLSLRTPLPESRCARTKEPPMTSQDSPLCWNMPS